MHRLERPAEPAAFTEAVAELLKVYPPTSEGAGTQTFAAIVSLLLGISAPASKYTENDRWEALRNEYREAFLAVRNVLEHNQKGICAYCEIRLRDTNRQVEHFIPKCFTLAGNDLTFDFSNMLLCCVGGTNPHSRVSGEFYKTPSARANHSCGEKKGDENPVDICLNPYELPTFPIFRPILNDNGISFAPDETACRRASIDPALVQSTLDFLNLNCPRLNRQRAAVWEVLEAEVTDAENLPKDERAVELASIAKAHLQDTPAFYTTKLLCLADAMPNLIP